MSKRSIQIVLLLAVVVIAAALFYIRQSTKSRYNWTDSRNVKAYSEAYDQPYGTQMLYRLLEDYFPGKQLVPLRMPVQIQLPIDSNAVCSYVFIGGGMHLDSMDLQQLLKFVAAGNTALIISKTIPAGLMAELLDEECAAAGGLEYEGLLEQSVTLSLPALLGTEQFNFEFADRNKPHSYFWRYMDTRFFCPGTSTGGERLGYLNDSLVCFARYPYGGGAFLLHSVPLAFTNFHLLREAARPYVAGVLSYLPEGDIYWDAISRMPEEMMRQDNNFGSNAPDEHPLTFLLQHAALAWAWYLLIGLAGLYLLFRAKRRQRIIPVLPKNENSSYEFISTIANLHFRARNYRGMSVQGMKVFTAQIRERYGLVAVFHSDSDLPRVDDVYFDRLSRVSGVAEAQIRDIFTRYGHCVRYEPTEQMMVELHLAMEAFFKQAK